MIGMPAFLSGAFFLSSGSTPQIPKAALATVAVLIAFAMVPITWYVLYKTPFGLRLCSRRKSRSGNAERPRRSMRYAGV